MRLDATTDTTPADVRKTTDAKNTRDARNTTRATEPTEPADARKPAGLTDTKPADPPPPADPLGGGRPGHAVDHSPTALESVCHSVAELARSASRQPSRVRVQHGQTTVEVEWQHPAWPPPPAPVVTAGQPAPAPGANEPAVRHADVPDGPPPPREDATARRYLCAAGVGTFYRSPEPGAPPYVSVGDLVRPGQPVGVLEVMKMMSTVESDAAGRVVEILVPDAHPVEYQQRLIALEPLSADQPG